MIKKLFIVLAFACSAFAGQISVDVKTATQAVVLKDDLSAIDSLHFAIGTSDPYVDSLFLKVEGAPKFGNNNVLLLSWIQNIEFLSAPKDNESMTVSVAGGAMEGDNTILLKDVKSVDFIDMDDELDTDGDGITDVYELFVYGSDPNKKTHKSNKIVEMGFYDTDLTKLGAVDINGDQLAVKLDSITNRPVIVKFKTEEPVDTVMVTYNDSAVAVVKTDDQNFTVKFPPNKVSEEPVIAVKVVSEAKQSKTYRISLAVPFSVSPTVNLINSNDGKILGVVFTPQKRDGRVAGYAILRATASGSADNKTLANFSVESSESFIDKLVPDGVSVLGVIERDALEKYYVNTGKTKVAYLDTVGRLSSFYTYRVVAYVKENVKGKDTYFYKFTNVRTNAAGRILFKYKLEAVGVEYYYNHCRADMRIRAKFNGNERYNYWFYNAGDDGMKDAIDWADIPDNLGGNNNAVSLDKAEYSMELGSGGVELRLESNMDCTGLFGSVDESAGHTIKWPYSKIADGLEMANNGTDHFDNLNHDGYFPSLNGSAVFSYGKGGVAYNNSNCSSGCGSEPHAGWKFWFSYDWIDDYDLVFPNN